MNIEKIKYLGIALASTAILSACTASSNTHGNMLQDYQIKEVKADHDNVTSVLRKLGSPTTKAPFDDNTWYYLGQKTQKRGIFDPEVVETQIVVVSFGDNGLVKEIIEIDDDKIDQIPYSQDKTETSGQEMTVIQQLLGNIGRFNPAEQ
jgi:outer membrane protein assembly factor BamE (lipoprotein component of BamABCDE complex)